MFIIFIRKSLLHVSTLLGHLQGEQFRYTVVAFIQLSVNVGIFTLNCINATIVYRNCSP
jgi:hypothetical protein